MPVDNIRKRKIGEQLTDWLVLGIRTGARELTEKYRITIGQSQSQAEYDAYKSVVDNAYNAYVKTGGLDPQTVWAVNVSDAEYAAYVAQGGTDSRIVWGKRNDVFLTQAGWIASMRIKANEYLGAAISKPRRARARINDWIADYDSINGAGTAVIFLGECLALRGIATLAEINAELTLLETQAQTLIDNNTGGWTLDQVATAIETNMEWESKQWQFPNLTAFVDTVLLDN